MPPDTDRYVFAWESRIYSRKTGAEIYFMEEATNRALTYPLNGIDQMDFSLWYDDPLASTIIQPGHQVVKVWRTIYDLATSTWVKPKLDDGIISSPDFCGVIGGRSGGGESGLINYTAYSPFWLLQGRTHINNHRIKNPVKFSTFPTFTFPLTVSNLLWKIIDLINNAFGADISHTGIFQGQSEDFGVISPYYTIAKGSNSWGNISNIVAALGSPDIVPIYAHFPLTADPGCVFLNTELVRGSDRTATVHFDYKTGQFNLEDLTFSEQIVPGKTANWIRSFGQGGKHSFSRRDFNATAPGVGFGYGEVGPWMREDKYDNVQTASSLAAKGAAALARATRPVIVWEPVHSPFVRPFFGVDYFLGDKIALSSGREGQVLADKAQRVYNVRLAMSDNNVEQARAQVADDFTDAVPP